MDNRNPEDSYQYWRYASPSCAKGFGSTVFTLSLCRRTAIIIVQMSAHVRPTAHLRAIKNYKTRCRPPECALPCRPGPGLYGYHPATLGFDVLGSPLGALQRNGRNCPIGGICQQWNYFTHDELGQGALAAGEPEWTVGGIIFEMWLGRPLKRPSPSANN